MLIDASYFVGELNIPNTDRPALSQNLTLFINKYEPKFLKIILGSVLYAEYVAGIVLDPIDPKWTALEDQLRNAATKVSPIANYIYFFFIRDKTVYTGGTGTQQAEGENSIIADSKIKTVRAWNEMNELSFEIYKFLKTNISVYGSLAYELYLRDNWLLWDWFYWWGGLFYGYRKCVPEIYIPINTLNW